MKLFIFSILLSFFCTHVSLVHATGLGEMTVTPSFQDITLGERDASASSSVKLTNNTDHDQQYDVFAIDFQQIDDQGNIALVDRIGKDYAYHLSSYIVAPARFVVSAKSTATLPIVVYNSQDLSPGGHYAAVIMRLGRQDRNNSVQHILPAVSSLLFLRKQGGEIFHLNLKQTDVNSQFLRFHLPEKISLLFINEGNTHVVPHGRVVLTDVFGHEIKAGTINESSHKILPQNPRWIPVTLTSLHSGWPIMFYSLAISGNTTFGEIRIQQQYSFLYVNPFFCIGTFLLIVVSILRRRRVKRPQYPF